MVSAKEFTGQNFGFVLELYEKYLESPESVDAKTAEFFRNWLPESLIQELEEDGEAVPVSESVDLRKVVGAVEYVQAIRQFGHLGAEINPLGYASVDDPELYPDAHGITEDDLKALPASLVTDGTLAQEASTAFEVVQELHDIYSGSIGWDNEHIHSNAERNWLREAIESRRYRYEGTAEENQSLT